jgi:hypothetical protein
MPHRQFISTFNTIVVAKAVGAAALLYRSGQLNNADPSGLGSAAQ